MVAESLAEASVRFLARLALVVVIVSSLLVAALSLVISQAVEDRGLLFLFTVSHASLAFTVLLLALAMLIVVEEYGL